MPKPRETQVERRLREGAVIIATKGGGDPTRPIAWTYADSGRAARADVCERLLANGKMIGRGDGLFPEDAQTFVWAS